MNAADEDIHRLEGKVHCKEDDSNTIQVWCVWGGEVGGGNGFFKQVKF